LNLFLLKQGQRGNWACHFKETIFVSQIIYLQPCAKHNNVVFFIHFVEQVFFFKTTVNDRQTLPPYAGGLITRDDNEAEGYLEQIFFIF